MTRRNAVTYSIATNTENDQSHIIYMHFYYSRFVYVRSYSVFSTLAHQKRYRYPFLLSGFSDTVICYRILIDVWHQSDTQYISVCCQILFPQRNLAQFWEEDHRICFSTNDCSTPKYTLFVVIFSELANYALIANSGVDIYISRIINNTHDVWCTFDIATLDINQTDGNIGTSSDRRPCTL